ncbi:filamentous hemagglutinin outer membrane protein [Fischerella sp. NIES-4106]|nr:filamentous hemagglutinin outer membrane protein [Fischerella sp. NIES-4106]
MKLLRYLSPVTTLSLSTVISLASITTATAQIVPDSSLGAESSVVNPDVIKGIPSDRIDGGAVRGSNLFHSFQEFNIGEGRGAYFSNPANIINIFTRVTGGNRSNILGKLGVLGNANLFLLNPKGIFFGPNASLDLGGSFFGTTADSFIFNNNFEFSATNPQAVPLLNVNIPIGLRFRENPGSITNQSIVLDANNYFVGLQVQPGNSLALVGGNINLSDGGRLTASGGSLELGGLATAGTVGLDITGNRFKLNFPTNTLLSDITISNARVQNVVFPGTTSTAGDIKITTNNLSLINGGTISATTFGRGNSGTVVINATGDISIMGENSTGTNSAIFSQVGQNAQGNSGGIQIKTNNLSLINGGIISATPVGNGNAGSVIINATGNISASGEDNEGFGSGIFSQVNRNAQGNSGGIQINTKDLSLTNGGLIDASTFGNGDAGRVIINATGDISIVGGNRTTGIFSQVAQNAQGNSGGIEIKTNNLSLTNGGLIDASTFGNGNAGRVIINVTGNIFASGESNDGFTSGIFSQIAQNAQGNSGGIEIKTNNLSLTNGGQISASTFGLGNAGRVIINATGNISFNGVSNNGSPSGIFSRVYQQAEGSAGGIEIKTNNLSLNDGGQISASTLGKGNAGSVIINATGNISASGESSNGFGSGINSSVGSSGVGDAGGIQISTKDVSLTDGGQINASTFGLGNAGSVIINATGNISVSGESNDGFRSGIFSRVAQNALGNSGGIEINTNNLSLSDGGQISASNFGIGDAGSVLINATGNISASGESNDGFASGIFSTVSENAQGNAGGILIRTKNLSLSNGAQIRANTFGQGDTGSVFIDATGTISLDGVGKNGFSSGIFSTVGEQGEGDAGDIRIRANNLFLTNSAQISASTFGNGKAGNIEVLTAKDIRLNNQASINAFTAGGGQGNISLFFRDLILRNNSNITTVAQGKSEPGSIGVFGDGFILLLKNSRIDSSAEEGFKGSIFITGGNVFVSPDSSIGDFEIPNSQSALTFEVPEIVIDPSRQIAQNPCQKGSGSSFTITGRGGLPSSPDDGFSSNETRVDLVEPVASNSTQAATTNQSVKVTNTNKPIIPAQGWIFNSKGEVVLTAYDPTATSTAQRGSKPTAACPAF